MKCIETGKVCNEQNRICKVCKLDNCKEVIEIIEDERKYTDINNFKKLEKELPEQCKNCSFFIVTNLDKQKVYCPYRIKERCMLK